MLIYNTTYIVEESDINNFLIWINEYYIPQVQATKLLSNPKLLRVLTHQDGENQSFSLQWEVSDSQVLHKWYTTQGVKLNMELIKTFKDKVTGIPTLLEIL